MTRYAISECQLIPKAHCVGARIEPRNPSPEFRLGFLTAADIQGDVHKILPLALIVLVLTAFDRAYATTKGLSQIVTPDLEPQGDVSISAQIQSERIGNPYQAQLEIGLLKWAEIAVFKGFKPNEVIFGTELGLIQHEPWLLSVGAIN